MVTGCDPNTGCVRLSNELSVLFSCLKYLLLHSDNEISNYEHENLFPVKELNFSASPSHMNCSIPRKLISVAAIVYK